MPPEQKNGDDGEDDDYMNMVFEDPTPKTETLTQRKKRLAREAEAKGKPKSKAEIAKEEREKREAALNSTALDTKSKGFKMMAALGYKSGTALGVSRGPDGGADDRLLEPIGLEMKDSRSGIGADSEKKRKFREEVEAQKDAQEQTEKKQKVDALDFRERQQKEREERKMEGQVWAAMKVCERLEEEVGGAHGDADAGSPHPVTARSKPLKSVNVLWRSLVKQRAINERDRRMRYDLHQSLSRRPDYDDPDEDAEDRQALGKKSQLEEVATDLDEEDEELEEFEALDWAEKLNKLVSYLRGQWNYCFWCKFRYPDENMDGCPGLNEEDHD